MDAWLNQNKNSIFAGVVILFIIGGGFVYLNQPEPEPIAITTPEPTSTSTFTPTVTPIPTETPTPTATSTSTPTVTNTPTMTLTPSSTPTTKPIRVYISGQVNQPNVYYLPPGSLITDVVRLAGGATEEADLVVINLALELKDQQQIHIPSKADKLPTPELITGGIDAPPPPTSAEEVQAIVASMATPTLPPSPPTSPPQSTVPPPATLPPISAIININSATAVELESLSGIGTVIAQRIIDYRTINGPFPNTESIMNNLLIRLR